MNWKDITINKNSIHTIRFEKSLSVQGVVVQYSGIFQSFLIPNPSVIAIVPAVKRQSGLSIGIIYY